MIFLEKMAWIVKIDAYLPIFHPLGQNKFNVIAFFFISFLPQNHLFAFFTQLQFLLWNLSKNNVFTIGIELFFEKLVLRLVTIGILRLNETRGLVGIEQLNLTNAATSRKWTNWTSLHKHYVFKSMTQRNKSRMTLTPIGIFLTTLQDLKTLAH